MSIVVPYWNVEKYLQACLESLQRQTFTDFEAILVDDGSQDSSREIAEKVCAEDARFRIVAQDNQGLGPARNTGVRAASGEFVTFVDSDDLVPRRAYQHMIESLDRTGSDLAAGDARRFTTLGVRDSYVHRHAFAQQRLKTHVLEYERIALDRMAWNKVFRRTFWDEHDLTFPPILYEDYPVTIRAHVLAESVDVLSEPVYYWRERDGGDQSITQRKWEVDNLRDRVESAVDVLDFLRDNAPQIAPLVQAHLRKIDLSALAAAVRENDDSSATEVLGLADRLRGRMAPEVLADGTPFERIQNRLLELHDVRRLGELMQYRAEHGTSGRIIRTRPTRRLAVDLPFRGDRRSRVPGAVYRVDPGQLGLDVQVVDCAWREDRLLLDLSVGIGSLPMSADSAVSVRISNAPADKALECPVVRFTRRRQHLGPDLCGVRVEVDVGDLVRRDDDPAGFWAVEVTASTNGIERTGTANAVVPGRARWPVPFELGHDLFVQPQFRARGPFGLWVRRAPHQVTAATADDGVIELRGTFNGPRPESPTHLLLTAGGMTEGVLVDVTPGADAEATHEFRATLAAASLIDHGNHDDPVEESTAWTPRLIHDGRELVLACGPDFDGAEVTAGSRRVAATRTGHGNLMIVESYAHPQVDSVNWHADDRLEIIGNAATRETCPAHIDLRCFVTPTDAIEHRVHTVTDGRTFTVELDVAALVAETVAAEHNAPLEGRIAARWHVLAPAANGPVTVTIGRDRVHRLPANRLLSGREVAFEAGRGEVFGLRVG
ncbi:glycosyltransferase [Nocardioidaceae bacterium SCSIO 66511]|nr:glycosyltransferase [Nocardioidaceae bacterium SCSIO 66511]